MVPLYPPPMIHPSQIHPQMHPPQMMYPPMPPGVILPHPYPIPVRYSPEVEEKLERIRAARSKEKRSERERRKSESDMEIRKALTYTWVDITKLSTEMLLSQEIRIYHFWIERALSHLFVVGCGNSILDQIPSFFWNVKFFITNFLLYFDRGLDRAIAESFLEQQERTNGSNIDCTSLNERGRCEDVVM